MPYRIATYNEGTHRFTLLAQISDDQAASVRDAIEAFHRFDLDQHLFLIALLNHTELTAMWDEHVARYASEAKMGQTRLVQMRLDMNRRLLNFLASFRSFLDQTDATLKRRYGEASDQRRAFRALTNSLYDGSYAYRLLYHIRHFAQHYSMAVDRIHASSVLEDGAKKTTIRMSFGRDALLSSGFDWNAKIRDEIAKGPEEIEIMPLVHDIKPCLERLGVKRVEIESPALLDAMCVLDPLAKTAMQEAPGHPCLLPVDFAEGENLNLSLNWFPMNSMTYLEQALKQQ